MSSSGTNNSRLQIMLCVICFYILPPVNKSKKGNVVKVGIIIAPIPIIRCLMYGTLCFSCYEIHFFLSSNCKVF